MTQKNSVQVGGVAPVGGAASGGAAASSVDHPVWAGAVVVGVSMKSGSPAALKWGLAEARRRGCPMVALTVFRATASAGTLRPTPARGADNSDAMARAALADVRRLVHVALGEHCETAFDVQLAAVRGARKEVLVRVSGDADLLVIDGSSVDPEPVFASYLLRNAQCPVVVMPKPIRRDPGSIQVPGLTSGV